MTLAAVNLIHFLTLFFPLGANLESYGYLRSALVVLEKFCRYLKDVRLGRMMLVVLHVTLPCGGISCGHFRLDGKLLF